MFSLTDKFFLKTVKCIPLRIEVQYWMLIACWYGLGYIGNCMSCMMERLKLYGTMVCGSIVYAWSKECGVIVHHSNCTPIKWCIIVGYLNCRLYQLSWISFGHVGTGKPRLWLLIILNFQKTCMYNLAKLRNQMWTKQSYFFQSTKI